MSTLGLTIKSQIESGAWEELTLAKQASDLNSLISQLDDADLSNDIPQAIYEFYGRGPSNISEDFAKVAINLQFNGVNIGDSVSQDQLRRLFLNPVEDEQNLGAKARDRLVFRTIINDLNGAGLTNERIFQDNISDTEAVVQGSVQDTLANYWQYTTGQAEVRSKNVDVIAKTIAEILGDIPAPPPSASAEAVEQISDAEAKQCVLLSLLGPLNDFYDETIAYSAQVNSSAKFPYEGKIIKFVCDPPNHFVNNLTAVPNINSYFTGLEQSTYSYLAKPSVDVRLSFIRSDGNALLDLPIIDVSEEVEANPSTSATSTPAGGAAPSPFDNAVTIKVDQGETPATAKIQAAKPKGKNENTTVKGPDWLTDSMKFEFDINYEGTNPSTSRNDVDVTITFQSSNLSDFIKNWNYSDITSIKDINFNLFDLVLFPLYTKDADGYGKNFRSQYSPNYNRIRLAYRARAPNIPDVNKIPEKHADIVEWYKQNSNVLDLTVVDHEFTRDDKYDFYTLKITYKGYVQSMLTSPETDALSNSFTKSRRAGRDLLVQEALAKGCSQTEIAKIISSINAASANDVSDVSNDFIKAISTRANVNGLGLFTLNFDSIKAKLKDNSSLKLEDIKKQIASYSPIVDPTAVPTTSLGTRVGTPKNIDSILNSQDNIYFFYLADILDVVLNHSDMYSTAPGSGDLASATRIKQELRFILGSFVHLDENGKTYNINIGHVPISVDYFKEWYKETIMDKELFLYPCLSFIRDLFEKVVTNLLNEVCFKTSEEQKVLVRTSFFTGTKNQASQFSPSNDRVLNFYWNGLNTTPATPALNANSTKTVSYIDSAYVNDFPLIKNEFGKDVNEYINYCVLYVQGAQQVGRTAPTTVVPHFKVNNSTVLGENDFSFSRSSQTGLREARYFRNSTTGITMLASVYNTDLTLEVPMCFLYPGHFYKLELYTGGNQRAQLSLGNGGKNYLFEELGLDGYYAITKVSHKIFGNIQNLQFDNKIGGLWVSSDNPYHSVRFQNLPESQKITDPTELTKQEDCNILIDLGNEISLKSLSDATAAKINPTIIQNRLAISNRPNADQELTEAAALRGLGNSTERNDLINNAFTQGASGTLTKPDTTKLNYTINNDTTGALSSVIDNATGNIVGVFQKDNSGNTIFIENPSYFSQGVEE